MRSFGSAEFRQIMTDYHAKFGGDISPSIKNAATTGQTDKLAQDFLDALKADKAIDLPTYALELWNSSQREAMAATTAEA